MAFIEELRQRKVVRVAVAYLVVAWLGVQVASIALPAFDAPTWVLRVLILFLALGFPLALILTWAIDLTPDGPRYSPGGVGWKRMVAISIGIGALALGWYFVGQPAFRDVPPSTSTAAANTPSAPAPQEAAKRDERSIAVLPFVNMSRDPANEYFSDGLAETTLDMLAKVRDLKVIARTSSFAFKGKNSDVREIGRALDAAHLLEGSVQQSGKMVRITAQLIRTRDGTHLWSQQYDRQLTDVFQIQDEIAAEVVKALQLVLPVAERERLTDKRTENVAAYQQYLRGNALLPKRRVSEMREALAHFERAIELDPGYAGAYAAASMTLGLLDNYAGSPTDDEKARRRRYIEQALRLNPNLGEAYAARAGLYESERNIAAADADYRRAIELAPSFATAYQWYAEFLRREVGEFERSLPLMRRALELDPLSPIIRNEYTLALAADNRIDEALEANVQLLREHPEFSAGYASRANLLEVKGDLVGALRSWYALIKSDPGARSRMTAPCATMLRFGAVNDASACADKAAAVIGEAEIDGLRRSVMIARGQYEKAHANLASQATSHDPWDLLMLQVATERYKAGLVVMKSLMPELFEQPPRLESNYPGDGVVAGLLVMKAGDRSSGQDLLRLALKTHARRPHNQYIFGRGWNDVLAWSLLGDLKQACNAIGEAVSAGYFLDVEMLEHMPQLAELRKQPCFEAKLAPARAKAAAQREAARKAGLL